MSEVVDHKTKGLIGQHSLQPLLVSYDISNDKRRYRLHKLLKAYGQVAASQPVTKRLSHGRRRLPHE